MLCLFVPVMLRSFMPTELHSGSFCCDFCSGTGTLAAAAICEGFHSLSFDTDYGQMDAAVTKAYKFAAKKLELARQLRIAPALEKTHELMKEKPVDSLVCGVARSLASLLDVFFYDLTRLS